MEKPGAGRCSPREPQCHHQSPAPTHFQPLQTATRGQGLPDPSALRCWKDRPSHPSSRGKWPSTGLPAPIRQCWSQKGSIFPSSWPPVPGSVGASPAWWPATQWPRNQSWGQATLHGPPWARATQATPHPRYPLISRWILGLLPYLGYWK